MASQLEILAYSCGGGRPAFGGGLRLVRACDCTNKQVGYDGRMRQWRKEIRVVRVSEQLIEEMVRTLVEEVGPRRIYLFGSHARGSQTSDSDIDLLIVEDEGFGPERKRWSELKRIRRALRPFRIPKDILVYSQEEFAAWEKSLNHIVARAAREGKLVYERP